MDILKSTLEELEKNFNQLADQNPNFDQRGAFWYSAGCVRQKLRDLGLEDPKPEAKAVGSVVQRKS